MGLAQNLYAGEGQEPPLGAKRLINGVVVAEEGILVQSDKDGPGKL